MTSPNDAKNLEVIAVLQGESKTAAQVAEALGMKSVEYVRNILERLVADRRIKRAPREFGNARIKYSAPPAPRHPAAHVALFG